MNTTTATKQTAGNNAMLRAAKRFCNTTIYTKAAATLNASGHDAAVAYLSLYFTASTVADLVAGKYPA